MLSRPARGTLDYWYSGGQFKWPVLAGTVVISSEHRITGTVTGTGTFAFSTGSHNQDEESRVCRYTILFPFSRFDLPVVVQYFSRYLLFSGFSNGDTLLRNTNIVSTVAQQYIVRKSISGTWFLIHNVVVMEYNHDH